MGLLTIGIGLAVAVYFLCEGLRNMKRPDTHHELDSFDEEVEQELINASELYQYLGVSKAEAKELMEAHSDIPRVCIEGETYYSKTNLREWLLKVSD